MASSTAAADVRAAVLGSPVEHSKSPVLHCAAYRALGLADWTYERIDCTGEQLPGLLDGFGPEWVGVSVTMPGKVAALAYATERTARAVLAGSANTLVRTESAGAPTARTSTESWAHCATPESRTCPVAP